MILYIGYLQMEVTCDVTDCNNSSPKVYLLECFAIFGQAYSLRSAKWRRPENKE